LGFSGRLSTLAKFLFKAPIDTIDIYVHEPTAATHGYWIVVADGNYATWSPMKGSGMALNMLDAFIKAIVELGEVYIVRQLGLQDRNGLSGGLLTSTAEFRAKAELIERDAFLYHYRNQLSFHPAPLVIPTIDVQRKILVYEMQNTEDGFYSYLATDSNCAIGQSPCLLIGLGAHSDRDIAISKAVGEYSTMHLDHILRPNWCGILEKDRTKAKRLPDFHHSYSRDPRNILRFVNLCSVNDSKFKLRSKLAADTWCKKKIVSPLRFFCFVQAENKSLLQLTFGKPEIDEYLEQDGPLYHPVW
jgi:hypothetical protein